MGLKRCFIIFLYVMMISRPALSRENIPVLGLNLSILSVHRPSVAEIFDAVEGREGFEAEVRNVVAAASSLRNGIPASVVEFKVSWAIVAKICFTDDICWAAKMRTIRPRNRETVYGIGAMMLVEDYCPNIPISKYKGYFQGGLLSIFTEWLEGRNLEEVVLSSRSSLRDGEIFTIPDKVVTSLAEFVYNLTTCPIPRDKCNVIWDIRWHSGHTSTWWL